MPTGPGRPIGRTARALFALLPRVRELGPPARTPVIAAFALLWGTLACAAAYAVVSLDRPGVAPMVADLAFSTGFLTVAAIWLLRTATESGRRLAWAIAAAAYAVEAVAWILVFFWLDHLSQYPPLPSVCDVLWLVVFYPLLCVFNIVLGHDGAWRTLTVRAVLDGVIAGAGIAALGGAVLLPLALSTISGDVPAVVTELGYTVWDMILLAVIFSVMSLRGWQWDRVWAVLTTGALLSVGVSIALSVLVAHGATAYGAVGNLG